MQESKIQSLWATSIYHDNFLMDYDPAQLINQFLSLLNFKNLGSDKTDLNLFENKELTELNKFKDLVILPRMKEYFKDVWNYEFWEKHDYNLKSWFVPPVKDYQMQLHNHSHGHLSSCFYLSVDEGASGGEIRFFDPRGNFNRGYSFVKEHFAPKVIQPSLGDFIIFPSSLFHDVSYHKGENRIVLIVDLYIDD